MSAETLAGTVISRPRWVYAFGGGSADGNAGMKDLLGGKGANLAEMSALGLPVPPGFTITTQVCNQYYAQNGTYPAELREQVAARPRGGRDPGWETIRRPGESAPGVGAVRRPGLHARHDGYRP